MGTMAYGAYTGGGAGMLGQGAGQQSGGFQQVGGQIYNPSTDQYYSPGSQGQTGQGFYFNPYANKQGYV